MIISTARKSLCKSCNADMKERLACEIYELITASGLPLVSIYKSYAKLLRNELRLCGCFSVSIFPDFQNKLKSKIIACLVIFMTTISNIWLLWLIAPSTFFLQFSDIANKFSSSVTKIKAS